jgi:hypothetical protein
MILRNGFFRDLPHKRELFDYGVRTDGQPVYVGHNKVDAATSDDHWIMFFFKYNAGSQTIEKYSLEGIWDDRATLFLAYA